MKKQELKIAKELAEYVYNNILMLDTEFTANELESEETSERNNFLEKLKNWIQNDYNYFIEYEGHEEDINEDNYDTIIDKALYILDSMLFINNENLIINI